MINLGEKAYKEMIAYSIKIYPIEACGLIAGKKEGKDIEIIKVYPLKNIDNSEEHFTMDSVEQFEILKKIRRDNMVLLGNFHSHPYTPSRLSDEDVRLAYDKSLLYSVISLVDINNPVLNIFKVGKENQIIKIDYLNN